MAGVRHSSPHFELKKLRMKYRFWFGIVALLTVLGIAIVSPIVLSDLMKYGAGVLSTLLAQKLPLFKKSNLL